MRKSFATVLILACATVAYTGYYFGVPYFLNTTRVENYVEKTVVQKSGFRIDFVNPHIKVGVIPSVELTADEFNVLNKDGSKALGVLAPNLKIKLLPLLFKNIEFDKINSDGVVVNLSFDNSQFYLGDYLLKSTENRAFNLNKASINLGQYLVTLDDKMRDKTLKLNGEYLVVDGYERDKFVKLNTKSKLYTGEKVANIDADLNLLLPLKKVSEDKVKLDLNIKNLDISDFTTYAELFSKGQVKELRGVVNLVTATSVETGHKEIQGHLNLKNFAILGADRSTSIYSDAPVDIRSDAVIVNDGVDIKSLKLLSQGIDVEIGGSVSKTNAKSPILDLKADINHIQGKNFVGFIPGIKNLSPDFDFCMLKTYPLDGKINGHVEVKGEANYPNLFGSILIDDLYLVAPIKDAPKNGTVKLSFEKHKMNIDVHVMTDKAEYVDVKGFAKLFRGKYTDLRITSTPNIDLVKVRKVVMPLHDILKFELGPVPMMNIFSGYGKANLHVAGSKASPHAWGSITFKDGEAEFITINNMVVKKLKGAVNFNNDKIDFYSDTAYLYDLPFFINGNCTLKGDLSVDVKADGQNSANLLKIINTSPILKELQDMMKPISSAYGKTKIFINIFGHVDRGKEPVFNKDLFARGSVEFLSNVMTFFPKKIPATDISGVVHFDRNNGDFNISAKLLNSVIRSNGLIKDKEIIANAVSHKFIASDAQRIASMLFGNIVPQVKGLDTISTSFESHYRGEMNIEKFDYGKAFVKGNIYSNKGAKSPIIVNSSKFELKNSHLKVSPIKGALLSNPFNFEIDVNKIMTPAQLVNGKFSMKNFNTANLNGLNLPQLKDFDKFNGKMDVASRITNNNVNLFAQLDGVSVVYKPKNLPVKILNGNVLFSSEDLSLNKINAYVGKMPVFVNGKIVNVLKNPKLNLYVNAKPSQEFFDQFFNSKSVYPIKLKGDVMFSSKITGSKDKVSTKTELKLDEASSLYYMGATVGDLVNPVKFTIDSVVMPKKIMLNNFSYEKTIASQNGKFFPTPQLTASGEIEQLKGNDVAFHNFKIKTLNPTDAKIFNIIFKKPIMKQGVFTSDIVLNGKASAPYAIGTFDMTSIDVPLWESTVKDVSLDFKPDVINIKVKSSVLDNEIRLKAVMKNKLVSPYTFNDFDAHLDNLDLNKITEAIQDYDTTLYKQNLTDTPKSFSSQVPQVVVKKGKISADKIKIKDLNATDFSSDFVIGKNMSMDMKNYGFKLADGFVKGHSTFNLVNKKLSIDTNIQNSNAQRISEDLFGLKGQVFGIINGNMKFTCDGSSQTTCINTLDGNGDFVVSNGRMPKLGSLEYLLKAGNLVSRGVTGISINGIIDLITPLKTGEFESIAGHYSIDDGIVKNLEIFSNGKDLKLYLSGNYDIESYIADMEVYGSLSNNITSVFGKLKNVSLNTLLNTIPFLGSGEISSEMQAKIDKIPKDKNSNVSRMFAVKIDGDINGINYVKSFKWVK